MPRVELPSGGWADFRDAGSLRQKDRKAVLLATDEAGDGLVAKGLAAVDGLLAMLITNWSFAPELPIPAKLIKSLDELSIPDYDALSSAAEEARKKLMPNAGDVTDPDSPPEPSSD